LLIDGERVKKLELIIRGRAPYKLM